MFVVSPDPPITEVEISYLTRIKATVAWLIIVLNKIDIDQLLVEAELRLQALRLPIHNLSQRIATFNAALVQFDDQHRLLRDLLAGDRQRTLEQIVTDAKELRLRARIALEGELDRALARGDDHIAARSAILAIVPGYFETELGRIGPSFQERLMTILDVHRQRMNELIELVRRTAANLMNVT